MSLAKRRVRDEPVRVRETTRCDRCCKRYVNIEAHAAKCTAPERRKRQAGAPLEEVEPTLRSIAYSYGLTLETLLSRDRSAEAINARVRCYQYLRLRHWKHDCIALYFGRAVRCVYEALAGPDRRRDYLRDYMRTYRQRGKA